MEPALIPCGFAMLHLYRNRNHMDAKVTDTVIQTLVFASVIAAVGTYVSPTLSWCVVIPPVVLFVFFSIYQRARAARTEVTTVTTST